MNAENSNYLIKQVVATLSVIGNEVKINSKTNKNKTNMENTVVSSQINVVPAWAVTHETITETSAFKMNKAGSYGTVVSTYYWTDKGWAEASAYGWYGSDIAWTEEDAIALKKEKMQKHLEYLENEKNKTEEKINNMKAELAK